jgi:hypothetical protein
METGDLGQLSDASTTLLVGQQPNEESARFFS